MGQSANSEFECTGAPGIQLEFPCDPRAVAEAGASLAPVNASSRAALEGS